MSVCAKLFFLLTTAMAPSGALRDSGTTRQQVDLIELNHFIDENGREVFQQVIFYDWSKLDRRFHVRAWRLIKTPSQLPVRKFAPPRYECSWYDDNLKRLVVARSMRETWSQQDPERVNRRFLPESQRIPLWSPIPNDQIDGQIAEQVAELTP
ncbi:hypothetical protein CA13_49790 [Planctomycetes bacterium CA13]|uniref:Uncharacterized protein n=1 Tax=Novipirellula herctigrandis TaxID=2527986 RepID=A0A5C5Z878_9BACT|nr:hypothetical protein CA13_49790 [Planctomycetes bacterium CA13]